MDRSIPMLLIGLIFGGGIGFAVAASQGVTLDGHDHADPAHHGHAAAASHDHATPYVLPSGADAPTLAIDLQPDPASGWNLRIDTTGFRFSPQNASRAHIPGEGHAHVYVNGRKVGRVYGQWVHLADMPEGDVTVEVTLNANDHRPLVVGDTPLSATATIAN